MKIYLNTSNTINNFKNTTKKQVYFKTTPIKNDCSEVKKNNQISFEGKNNNTQLLVEAKLFLNQSVLAQKDSELIKDDSIEQLNKAENIKNEFYEFLSDSRIIFNQLKTLPIDSQGNDAVIVDSKTGELMREIYDVDDSKVIVQDYKNGVVDRRVIFSLENISLLQYHSDENKFDSYIFDKITGELLQYTAGVKSLNNGYDADYQILCDGLSFEYSKNIKNRNNDMFADKYYLFQNGELNIFIDGYELINNEVQKAGKYYRYCNDILQEARINHKERSNQYDKAEYVYFYTPNEQLDFCAKEYFESHFNDKIAFSKMFKYGANKLQGVYLDAVKFKNTLLMQAEKVFHFNNDVPKRCDFEYKVKGESKGRAERKVWL